MSAETPALYLALWLPRFHLQAVLRTNLSLRNGVLALLDDDGQSASDKATDRAQILHANVKAERFGVVAGLTSSQALARCPKLQLLSRDAQAEGETQQDLLQVAALWTPDFESSQPGLCLLNLSRVRHLENVKHSCGPSILQWLHQRHLDGRIGMAQNADLAILAARAAKPILILEGSLNDESSLLQNLPIAALQPSADLAKILRLWGIQTLEQFAALSRSDIAARLGTEGLHLWDVASGGRERLLKLVRPVVDYREEMELEHPLESLEPLLFLFRRMLGNLCSRLTDAWMVASAQELLLRFDDHTNYEKTLRVAEPTRDADLLLRVLHTHLEGMSASSPIVSVALGLTPTRPVSQQVQLFERSLRDPHRFAETLAQLEALLGTGKVGWTRLFPSRKPDAFMLVNDLNVDVLPQTSSRKENEQGLPLRRFRPAQKVLVRLLEGRPETIQTNKTLLLVKAANGPWFLSGDWWDQGSWGRMIWEIAASDGELYQLAQEKEGWLLEGIFG